MLRFRQLINPAILRKFDYLGSTCKTEKGTKVVSVEPTNKEMKMFDITTSTGNFIAKGVVSHNCFAPSVLHRDKEIFHNNVQPREGIVEAVKAQLGKGKINDKLIHLCFTCDPYPTGYDTSVTREIIELIKDSGNHVQILTKGNGKRDLDLLDENDWYGITYDGSVGGVYKPTDRIVDICAAKRRGIKTWCSFEPVIDADNVLECIKDNSHLFDKVKIGKLNYYPSDINWKEFGIKAETLCKELGLDYYIKESLRAEMEK